MQGNNTKTLPFQTMHIQYLNVPVDIEQEELQQCYIPFLKQSLLDISSL